MAKNLDKVGSSWSFRSFDLNLNVEKSNNQGMEKPELEGCSKVFSDDIADLLPVDPFGMDIKSTVTAIKGWLQEFDEDFGSNFSEKNIVDDELFEGLDLFLNGAMEMQPEKGNLTFGAISIRDHGLEGFLVDHGLNNCGFDSKYNLGDEGVFDKRKELQVEGGDPHDALFFALSYLGVKDLLVVERVCKPLRDAVRGDALLWRSIHVDQPLSGKVTDQALLKLTNRAQGSLECLSLVECIKITDNGLKQVLETNPRLTKLCVPGCVRLSVNSILSSLRLLKSAGNLRIKHLRIGGLFGVTEKHFEELKSLLGADKPVQLKDRKPRFYRLGELYLSCDDACAIDIEICPKCQKLKLVYDCPAESCQGKDQANQSCRACTLCIARCINCGSCIKDCDYEETFCLDFLCLVCLKQLLSCQEAPESNGASSSGHTVVHRGMSYKFCFYGE
ncbi:hypothetical protein JCGZ_10180 [Jatropha curcas]|uniref:F-box domain-containing protein n=1 Tax=Jatropha curcas TaxID=180498 RepID=A0A067LNC2_JATCU|nr:F-box protein SKIP14 [Jatropha curcas]KDP46340.1 hypothetical protein JCGZ_10180 [Jatropha curcas]